jgi:hypothetical protein
MKAIRFLICVAILGLSGWLAGCGDHRIPAVAPGSVSTRLRVKTITESLPGNQSNVSNFRYDAQGRLSRILAFQTPDSTTKDYEVYDYRYDSQNRLTGVSLSRRTRGGGLSSTGYGFEYNTNSQVREILGASNAISSIQYNAANKVSTITSATGFRERITRTSNFTFTGDNLTTWAFVETSDRSSNTTTKNYALTYDTNVNPFYGLFIIPAPSSQNFSTSQPFTYYGGLDNVLNLSRNNALTSTDGTTTTTYTYVYNGSGLPTQRVTTGPGFSETLNFEYETY